MTVVQLADTLDPVRRLLVPQMAPDGIGRIRRVDNNPAIAQNFNRLMNQPFLGIVRVNLKKLAHTALSFCLHGRVFLGAPHAIG